MRAPILLGVVLAAAMTRASPAEAKPIKVAGKGEVASTIEVPLYAGPDPADTAWYVEAKVGDKSLLLRVATGHPFLKLSEGAAAKIGLKVVGSKDDGKRHATAAAIDLGSAKLTGVRVEIDKPFDPALGVDGELGIAGFPTLAFAVLPSKGVVTIAPAPGGDALVAGVGTPLDWGRGEDRKYTIGGDDYEYWGVPYAIPVAYSGVEVPSGLASEESTTKVWREATESTWWNVKGVEQELASLPPAPSRPEGATTWERREVGLGGTTVQATVRREGAGIKYAHIVPATLGQDVLAGFDFAVSPAAKSVALAAAKERKSTDYGPVREAELRKALDPPPADPAAKAPVEPTAEAKRLAGAQAELAAFLAARGSTEEALALAVAASAAEPAACTSFLPVGDYALALGRSAEAAAAYTKAAELYEPWAARPLAERTKITKDKAALEKVKGTWTGAIPQDHSCHVARAGRAWASLQSGDFAAAVADYPAKLDLDEGLAVAAGSAFLLSGRVEEADAAFRQAVKLTEGRWPADAREGLMLAWRGRSPAMAAAQIDPGVGALSQVSGAALDAWVADMARGSDGLRVLRGLAGAWADVPAVEAAVARGLRVAGDASAADAAAGRALDAAEADVVARPRSGSAWAVLAVARASAGRSAEAAAALDRAKALAPAAVDVAWAGAVVAGAAGDSVGASALGKRAAILGVRSPAYAQLLAK
jgi:tetratricopeptide (TPR) repeat protein